MFLFGHIKSSFFHFYKLFFIMTLTSTFLLPQSVASERVRMDDYVAWKYGRKSVFENIKNYHDIVNENQSIIREVGNAIKEDHRNLEHINIELFEETLKRELGQQTGKSTPQRIDTSKKAAELIDPSTICERLLASLELNISRPYGTMRSSSESTRCFPKLLKAAKDVSETVGGLTAAAKRATTDQSTLNMIENLKVDNLQDFNFSIKVTEPQVRQPSIPKVQMPIEKEEPRTEINEESSYVKIDDIQETLLSLKDDLEFLQENAEKTPEEEIKGTLRIVSGEVKKLKKTFKQGKLSEAFRPPEKEKEPEIIATAPSIGIAPLLKNELSSMMKGVKMRKNKTYTTMEIVSKMKRSQKDMLLALIIANQEINLSELGPNKK